MHELGDREPASREGEMIAAIRAAYLEPDAGTSINTRQTTACGGVSLHPGMVNRCDVKRALDVLVRANILTWRQYMVLWLRYAKDKTQEATAKRLGIGSRNTIAVDEARGLEILIGYIWQEPGYKSPPRTRRLNPERDPLKGMARTSA